ncbi:MAG: electron transfer flavoprotein subunit alpha/FixB family protein [Anaerolineales bacterium]|jgi:electron transfer flavoprotein alpha subunit
MNQDIYVIVEHILGQISDISYVMLAAARVLAQGTGGDVVAVLLGHNAQELASDLSADQVLYVDHPVLADFTPEAYQKVLAELVRENTPRVVLFGHTSMGTDVVSGLAAQLDLPLLTQCYRVRAEGGVLKFVSQICGGKIMAEGELPSTTSLVTMVPGGFKPEKGHSTEPPTVTQAAAPAIEDLRISLKQYIEPEAADVDISKEPILVAVGRGIQREDNLELAEELVEALGGTLCASRPVVDQGWLPTSRLVGKSGKKVKPEVYLALGISGAPEHVEAITDSETIIAVNTDPLAPIFDIAQYGVEADMFDLLPVIIEKIQEVKSA